MTQEPPTYRSYLLRLWRAERDGQPIWRASLESAQTGERRTFAGLAALCAFLEEQIDDDGSSGDDSPADTQAAGRSGHSSSARNARVAVPDLDGQIREQRTHLD